MTKRDVIRAVLDHRKPPYVPWHFGFTVEAREKLLEHYGSGADLEELLGNHLVHLGSDMGTFASGTSSAWSGTAASTRTSATWRATSSPRPP
jgi:uroporphyrinogen decarboxylase